MRFRIGNDEPAGWEYGFIRAAEAGGVDGDLRGRRAGNGVRGSAELRGYDGVGDWG